MRSCHLSKLMKWSEQIAVLFVIAMAFVQKANKDGCLELFKPLWPILELLQSNGWWIVLISSVTVLATKIFLHFVLSAMKSKPFLRRFWTTPERI